jgi:DNA-binding MarR family transcriptional regulator
MVAMVGRLLQLGYLKRERDAVDQRQWLLTIDEAGREALHFAAPRFDNINERLDTLLPEDQAAALVGQLRSIIKEFGA